MAASIAAALGTAVFGPGIGADTDPTVSPVTFDTCGTKLWTVPAGVTSAAFALTGGSGGDAG